MTTANRILKIVYDTPQSIKQINTILNTLPKTTIYGRVSELKTRKLVKKIGGKFVITDKGKTYINEITESYVFKEQVQYNYEIEKPNPIEFLDWLYSENVYDIQDQTLYKIGNTTTKIYAQNNQQAYKLAKLIYGSDVEIKNIE